MAIHIFGIRHHGPGCARALRAALDELQPDVLALELPGDVEPVLPLVAQGDWKLPVALLVYRPEVPREAAFYPFAEFSPEWQALRWAAAKGVPIYPIDLPQRHALAMAPGGPPDENDQPSVPQDPSAGGLASQQPSGQSPASPSPPTSAANGVEPSAAGLPREADQPGAAPSAQPASGELLWRADPLAVLAKAAGYQDPELWWEEQIERRRDACGLFQAIFEAMHAVRSELGETDEHHLIREAWMRQNLRDILRTGASRIAVVCGAWHAPVLDEASLKGSSAGPCPAADKARLCNLPRCKTQATWVPWTYWRLASWTGYGAGVRSPGWYEHLWRVPEKAPVRWVATAARLLRGKDLDASSASVIETVRLAEALAALRGLRSPGLAELNESILAVLCNGDPAPLGLVRRELEVGHALGEVPPHVPATPLAADLQRQQKRLRLSPSAEVRHLDLDLRKPNDLARSQLLHRLLLLGIAWGQKLRTGGGQSTFHELWLLEWTPELAVAVIEANVWGNTLAAAASAKAIHDAEASDRLATITETLDQAILAGLDEALPPLLVRLQTQAALAADVRHLMDAMLPLARIARYSDVRGTQAGQVMPILMGMFERAMVGLAAACHALSDEAAEEMVQSIGHVQQALDLLDLGPLNQSWQETLGRLIRRDVHGLIRGWCCRLLLEKGVLAEEELYRMARLALAPANPPAQAAAWAAGLLRGSGMLLLHHDGVWLAFDRWLGELTDAVFREMLPLVRRAFADFTPAERRQMGEKVKRLGEPALVAPPGAALPEPGVDLPRARKVLPVLARILGVHAHAGGQ